MTGSCNWQSRCMKIKVFRLKKSARRWEYHDRRFISTCGSKKESKNKLAPAHRCRKSTIVQLMDDARKRKFAIVLVWKFDRFARSLKMLVDSLALFQEL